MTLIQTGKAERFPVVLIGRSFWTELIGWIEKRMLDTGYAKIDREDLDLFVLTDSLNEARDIILEAAEKRSYPSHPVLPETTAEGTVTGKPSRPYPRKEDQTERSNSQ
jgi:predicted Rossmann-fold nucleotide-binding protein